MLLSIIDVIGRRSSEDYALVMVSNTIKKLCDKYNFLKLVQIKKTRYSEIENIIDIDSSIDQLNPDELGKAFTELIDVIVIAMGKNAGFFFIKEVKNKIGSNYGLKIRNMGVDLDFMQFSFEVDKKQIKTIVNDNEDVFYRSIKILIDILENKYGRAFAVSTIQNLIDEYSKKYDFLKKVKIIDVRYTFGANEIDVDEDLDALKPSYVGMAIQDIIFGLIRNLQEIDKPFQIDDFKRQLPYEYKRKLTEMGVDLNKKQIAYPLLIKHVIKALIEVLSNVSTQQYAIFAMNSFLKNIDNKYDFLKQIKITSIDSNELCNISIMTNLNELNETDVRRSIQNLLEQIIDSIGEKLSQKFIDDFKNSLENFYLLKIEEMGVNLHLIQLRHQIRGKI